MRLSIQEVARKAGTAKDLDAFWRLIHDQLVVRGASSALFGVLASRRELEHMKLSKALIWRSSHSREFLEAFDADEIVDNDRTAGHCVADSEVMFWHDPRHWQDATPAEIKRAQKERDLGLAIGFTVPSSHFFPDQVGGAGISMPDVPLREFGRFWKEEGRELVTLCGILDAGMRGQHLAELVNLSAREKECLTWLAVGLRPDRIADRLGVGDKAVEKYVNGARRKLKAATRDHAVAKALMLGLIEP